MFVTSSCQLLFHPQLQSIVLSYVCTTGGSYNCPNLNLPLMFHSSLKVFTRSPYNTIMLKYTKNTNQKSINYFIFDCWYTTSCKITTVLLPITLYGPLKLGDQCGIRSTGKDFCTIEKILWENFDTLYPDGEKSQILSRLTT